MEKADCAVCSPPFSFNRKLRSLLNKNAPLWMRTPRLRKLVADATRAPARVCAEAHTFLSPSRRGEKSSLGFSVVDHIPGGADPLRRLRPGFGGEIAVGGLRHQGADLLRPPGADQLPHAGGADGCAIKLPAGDLDKFQAGSGEFLLHGPVVQGR